MFLTSQFGFLAHLFFSEKNTSGSFISYLLTYPSLLKLKYKILSKIIFIIALLSTWLCVLLRRQ